VNVPQSETIHVELDPAEVVDAHARHRRRFAGEVARLDTEALNVPSRCDKWTTADVLRHLCDVDEWMLTLWSGGRPPFNAFDPNTTPHEFVLKRRELSDEQVRDDFVASSERLAADVEGSGPERWGVTSISPVGFVPWWLSALHVFYDSWVHERDALLPIGMQPPVLDEEAVPVLTYSLALTGTFGGQDLDTVVCGVHLVAGQQPVVSKPVAAPGDDVGTFIDAINGRAEIDELLVAEDPEVVRRLGALARFFHSAA